jgi:acyl-coenzyme A thioesterase 13
MQSEADKSAADKIRSYVSAYADSMPPENIDGSFIRQSVLSSATVESDTSNAKAVWKIDVPVLCSNNRTTKNTHGGAIATFFDNATSMAVFACKNAWEDSGVTRSLNVTYFRPPVEGEPITIECEVLQLAKRLATIRGVMKRDSDGTVLAICQHDKYRPSRPTPGKPKL